MQSYDELGYARAVAERYGTVHTEEVVSLDAIELLPDLAEHYDEPFADSSAVPTFRVAQLAARAAQGRPDRRRRRRDVRRLLALPGERDLRDARHGADTLARRRGPSRPGRHPSPGTAVPDPEAAAHRRRAVRAHPGRAVRRPDDEHRVGLRARLLRDRNGLPNDFDPPWTTVHVGMIAGGTANNITARDCTFSGEVRCLPDETVADWRAPHPRRGRPPRGGARRIHPDAAIALRDPHVAARLPRRPRRPRPWRARSPATTAATLVCYQTEAGHFQARGLPTVICGPGSIAQAHQPDEFITRSSSTPAPPSSAG